MIEKDEIFLCVRVRKSENEEAYLLRQMQRFTIVVLDGTWLLPNVRWRLPSLIPSAGREFFLSCFLFSNFSGVTQFFLLFTFF